MTFENYKQGLMINDTHYVEDIHSFRSRKLHMQSICQKKKVLDNTDDKRIANENSFMTYAYGHYKTVMN